MKRLLLSLTIGLVFHQALAQSKTPTNAPFNTTWNAGAVLFHTGDSLECLIRYNHALPVGILQIKKGDNILTISPSDVKNFAFRDASKQRLRKFYSIALARDEGEPTHAFMECLYADQAISILSHKTVGMPRDFMNYTWFISKPARVNRRYILDAESGELLPMSRENALKVIDREKSHEVSAFIENHRIRFRSVSEYIDVFEYYSSL